MVRIRGVRGEKVQHGGVAMTVRTAIDLETLLLCAPDGELHHAKIAELEKEAAGGPKPKVVHDEIRLAKVAPWRKACSHLLDDERHTKEEVGKAAAELGVSIPTVYRALERWRLTGDLQDLPPPTRNGGRGKSRLRDRAEEIIQDHIDLFLGRKIANRRQFCRTTTKALTKAGLVVSEGTLRERFAAIPAYKLTRRRKGRKAAAVELDPIKDHYPNLSRPLQVVQIDHWKADIEIVSDDRTISIGRCWLTIGICIWSRMIFGLHVGLDAPGNVPFGMMMINGLLSKNHVAEEFGFDWDNPMRGLPETIEMDNAKEFTGRMAQKATERMNIDLKLRPVEKPQYGQYIERFNGNLATRFKELPGATGSSTQEKKREQKDPQKTAALTLADTTELVWRQIDEYHNDVHTGIGMTPLEKFKGYYFGPEGQRHRVPDTFVDNLAFRVIWYPMVHRTVQRYGIRIDHLDYYSESLEWLVRNRKDYGSVEVRRNPFDVRTIYVRHPALSKEAGDEAVVDDPDREDDWIIVKIRQIGFPEASIYELRDARRLALARKREPTPEVLAEIIEEQQALIETAVKKTRSAKRVDARNRHHRKEATKARNAEGTVPAASPTPSPPAFQPPSSSSHRDPPDTDRLADEGLSRILADIDYDDLEEFLQ